MTQHGTPNPKLASTSGGVFVDPAAMQGDAELPSITEAEYKKRTQEVVAFSRKGHQIAVVDSTGNVRSIIGLNGVRALPKPPLDPLIADLLHSDRCQATNKAAPWVT